MESVIAPLFIESLQSIARIATWHEGATFQFMGHQYIINARGRFHSLKDPWVYDAEIASRDADTIKGSSRHLKSEKGAIEHAFKDFINQAVQKNLITNEQASQLIKDTKF
jgi:hypothetical protein